MPENLNLKLQIAVCDDEPIDPHDAKLDLPPTARGPICLLEAAPPNPFEQPLAGLAARFCGKRHI